MGSECVDIYHLFMKNLARDPRFNYPTYLEKFRSLKTNPDRLSYVYKDIKEKCPNIIPFLKDGKSDVAAVGKRQIGNAYFKSEKYREALDYYTISISLADGDEVLAMAYANRSAALFRLDLHAECLVDIERALQHGYPKQFEKKLFKRRAECRKDPKTQNYEPAPTIPNNEKHPLIECAKNCVEIVRKKQYGRCVMATRDIEVGEVLAVEEPFAALLTDEVFIHCHHCCQLCYNLIPCKHCTRALYCSESCADGAFAEYHKYECPILLSLDSIMIDSPKRLALKMTLMAKGEMQQPSNDYTLQDNEIYRCHRYKEVFNLEAHIKKRSAESLLARTTVAAALFHLIKTRTTFLRDGVQEDLLKEHLVTLVLISGTNNVNIDEFAKQTMLYDLVPFANGIYPCFSLFNHSCWPNVIRYFHGSKMVVVARFKIKKGEQCFVNYGPMYPEQSKQFRQNFLKHSFFFTCTCVACREDWSDIQALFHLMCMVPSSFVEHIPNVEVAKNELKRLLVKARRMQFIGPSPEFFDIDAALRNCYYTLGSKRAV